MTAIRRRGGENEQQEGPAGQSPSRSPTPGAAACCRPGLVQQPRARPRSRRLRSPDPADTLRIRRVLRAPTREPQLVKGPDRPGAGPDAAVPGRAPDEDARRQRARRPERRPGTAPRGLPLDRRLRGRTSPRSRPSRHLATRPPLRDPDRSGGGPASSRPSPRTTTTSCATAQASRAQAVRRDDSLVDGFRIETARDQVHVLNAPSPAATSAHEIARHIADRVRQGM